MFNYLRAINGLTEPYYMKKVILSSMLAFVLPLTAFAYTCPPEVPHGGGTVVYCSSPFAPGWTVGAQGGGKCGSTQNYVQYNHALPDGTKCQFWSGCMIPR